MSSISEMERHGQDHIGNPNGMICPHCGLPADRSQNGIQGYRCGSSYEPNFRPQWARSMTCLEIENKKLKGDLDLSYFGEDALIANVRNLRAHIKRLEEAGDQMIEAFVTKENDSHWNAILNWTAAKEDKP
jgi:hypothetical protein